MIYLSNENHADDHIRSHANLIGESHALMNVAVDMIDQLTTLNLKIAMNALHDGAQHAQLLLEVDHPHQVISLHAEKIHPVSEMLVEYAVELFQITNVASAKMTELLNSRFQEMSKELERRATEAAHKSPIASEVALAAVKTATDASKAAYDKIVDTAKQATELAQKQAETLSQRPPASSRRKTQAK